MLARNYVLANADDVGELAAYTCISGGLQIESTDLSDISLPGLKHVRGDVIVRANASLANLVLGIETIGSGGGLLVQDNFALTTLDLSHLSRVDGTLGIATNLLLGSLGSLSALKTVGSIRVNNNGSLKDMDLSSLTTIKGALRVTDNASLQTLDVRNLAIVESRVDIDENPDLTDISFNQLTSVKGAFEFVNNASVSTLDVGRLKILGGSLVVRGNAALESLVAGSLQEIGGEAFVSDNLCLAALDLGNLAKVTGDGIVITNNHPLRTVDLGSLTVAGSIHIRNSEAPEATGDSLEQVDLSGLTSLTGSLSISSTKKLSSLLLGALQTVVGDLSIRLNEGLPSLTLGSLKTVGRRLTVTNNAVLSCNAAAFSSQVTVIGDTVVCANKTGNGCGPDICP